MASATHATLVNRPEREVGRYYGWLGNLVLALAFIGFPIAASLSQILGVQSNEISIGYRAFHGFLAILLIFFTITQGRFKLDLLVTGFLFLYLIRLLVELIYSNWPDITANTQFFVSVVLLPTIAMAGGRNWFDERTCLRFIIVIGGTGGLLIAYLLATGEVSVIATNAQDIRASLNFLNPITIGYHGLFLIMASLITLARHRTRSMLVLSIAAAIIGGYLLIVAGSRGPVVAFVSAVLITGAANRSAKAAYVFGGIIVFALVAFYGLPEAILDRFRDIGTDFSSMQRVYAMQLSIEAAFTYPLFGYAYIEPVTGMYPHNLLVESGLALGVGGAALMLWMQVSLVWNALLAGRSGQLLLPFAGSAMLANAWLSGSLWGSASFFMILYLLRDIYSLQPAPVKLPLMVQPNVGH